MDSAGDATCGLGYAAETVRVHQILVRPLKRVKYSVPSDDTLVGRRVTVSNGVLGDHADVVVLFTAKGLRPSVAMSLDNHLANRDAKSKRNIPPVQQ